MSNRGSGRTHKMMMEVKDDPKMTVLVHSQAFAEYLKRVYKPKCKIEAYHSAEKYKGIEPRSLIVGHYLRESEEQELNKDE